MRMGTSAGPKFITFVYTSPPLCCYASSPIILIKSRLFKALHLYPSIKDENRLSSSRLRHRWVAFQRRLLRNPCHLSNMFLPSKGGAERLIVDAASGLQKRGHTVHIYTSYHDPNHCFEETRDGAFVLLSY